MSHEDYKEMIPAHALSALDAAEDRVLREHLIECAECRIELDDWQATTAGLAFSADPAEPSPQVRARILGQVREVKVSGSKVIPFTAPQKNIWSSFGTLGAIAAAVLFAALLVYVVLLWKENRAIQAQNEILAEEIRKTHHDLDEQTKLVRMFTKPGTRMTELTGTPMAPGANAKLAYDTSGHAMIMAQGLPAAPSGKEYQLWFIVANKPMRGGTFSTDNHGIGVMEDQVPAEAMNSAVFAITLEPKGGVRTPTGQMYLLSRS